MKRRELISLIDVLAFICFVLLVSTGVLLEYLLPPGSGRWVTVWAMSRHDWGAVHFWVAVLFLIVLVVHLVLHKQFIVSLFSSRKREQWSLRMALAVLALCALLAIAIAPLLSPVEQVADRGRHAGEQLYGTQ